MRLFDYGGKLTPFNSFKEPIKEMDNTMNTKLYNVYQTDMNGENYQLIAGTSDLEDVNKLASKFTDEQFQVIDEDDEGIIHIGYQKKYQTLSGYFVRKVWVEVV